MKKYDLVIVLGSQIKKQGVRYTLAPHTELKAQAAGVAWKKGITKRFIISGGYNFGVRYDGKQILPKADFSFEAFAKARNEKSEAEIIKDFLRDNYGVPETAMFLEELSAYTKEQAEILRVLLTRTTFSEAKKIAILTLLYHMKRALPTFRAIGLKAEPLFAEDLLALEGKLWIERICRYYSAPKGGKQWNTEKIRELLSNSKTIGELLQNL